MSRTAIHKHERFARYVTKRRELRERNGTVNTELRSQGCDYLQKKTYASRKEAGITPRSRRRTSASGSSNIDVTRVAFGT